MQVIAVIICNDSFYFQKSAHYEWALIFYYIFDLELLFLAKVINFVALPWG